MLLSPDDFGGIPPSRPTSIVSEFECRLDCEICKGAGAVCEDHPGLPWYPMGRLEDGACFCGAAGMPCPGRFP